MLNIDDRLIKEVLPKIEPNGLAVLLAVAIHINHETEVAFPSNERLQKLTGLGRNSVEAALRCLRENGLLASHQEKQKGKFGKRFLSVTTDFISIFVSVRKAKPFTDLGGTVDGGTVEPSTVDGGTNYIKEEGELINELEQINKEEEEKPASRFSSSSENEKSNLEAKKEKTPPPSSAPPPPKKDYGNLCPDCHGAGWHLGRSGRETCETCLGNGLNSERLLHPPFTPIGTIEPQPATIVRLYDNELPGATIVDSVPGTYETKRDPRETPPQEFRRVNVPDEIERLKTDEAAKETFALVRKIPSAFFDEYVEAFGREIKGTGESYQNLTAFKKHFFNWSGTRYEIAQKKQSQTNGKGSSLNRAGGDLSNYQKPQLF